jgi:hypothetical protein
MNNKLALTTFILSATLLSTAALARGGDHDGWHDRRHHGHHGHHGWRSAPAHVVYAPPRPVYVRPPVAYYRPAYYPQPVYVQPRPAYVRPPVAYYPQPAYAPTYYAPARVDYRGDRVAGQVHRSAMP